MSTLTSVSSKAIQEARGFTHQSVRIYISRVDAASGKIYINGNIILAEYRTPSRRCVMNKEPKESSSSRPGRCEIALLLVHRIIDSPWPEMLVRKPCTHCRRCRSTAVTVIVCTNHNASSDHRAEALLPLEPLRWQSWLLYLYSL